MPSTVLLPSTSTSVGTAGGRQTVMLSVLPPVVVHAPSVDSSSSGWILNVHAALAALPLHAASARSFLTNGSICFGSVLTGSRRKKSVGSLPQLRLVSARPTSGVFKSALRSETTRPWRLHDLSDSAWMISA